MLNMKKIFLGFIFSWVFLSNGFAIGYKKIEIQSLDISRCHQVNDKTLEHLISFEYTFWWCSF